jgi:hypothetical protein
VIARAQFESSNEGVSPVQMQALRESNNGVSNTEKGSAQKKKLKIKNER